jgi:hypothetical protein
MNTITFTSRATTAVVAGVAGFSSYRHIVEVAQRAGEHAAVAAVLPLSIDGLIVVGTMAMVEDKRAGRRPRISARVALGVGVIATLAANIASAQPHLTARLVAAVPAVAFLITVEVLARIGRQRAGDQMNRSSVSTPVLSAPVSGPVFQYDRPIGPEPDVDQVVKLNTPEPVVRKPHASAKDRVERAHRRTPEATHEQLAERLKLSASTVRRWRPPKLEEPASVPTVNGHQPDLEVAR